uniref:Uncharacterized protein n=1 Tax=Cacopsylla melanoneura TaxID=428564 RepID=A0A8D8W3Y7_9HEMI
MHGLGQRACFGNDKHVPLNSIYTSSSMACTQYVPSFRDDPFPIFTHINISIEMNIIYLCIGTYLLHVNEKTGIRYYETVPGTVPCASQVQYSNHKKLGNKILKKKRIRIEVFTFQIHRKLSHEKVI